MRGLSLALVLMIETTGCAEEFRCCACSSPGSYMCECDFSVDGPGTQDLCDSFCASTSRGSSVERAEAKNTCEDQGAGDASPAAACQRPTLSGVSPGIVCVEQGEQTIELTGLDFGRDGEQAELAVEGIADTFPLQLSECATPDGACQSGTASLSPQSIGPGYPALSVSNAGAGDCGSEEVVMLRVIAPPVLIAVMPSETCVDDLDSIVIEGAGFLEIDGARPVVSIDQTPYEIIGMSDCISVETQGHDVMECSSIDIGSVAAAIGPGAHDFLVENPAPAGCDAVATGALVILSTCN